MLKYSKLIFHILKIRTINIFIFETRKSSKIFSLNLNENSIIEQNIHFKIAFLFKLIRASFFQILSHFHFLKMLQIRPSTKLALSI